MTTENKLDIIYSIFKTTEIDEYFIEAATNYGWADYFANLDLDENDELAIEKCYKRCIAIMDKISLSLVPDEIMIKLSKSREGSKPTIIELQKEVGVAILEYNKAHEVCNYLLLNGMMTDEIQEKLSHKISTLSKLIKESGCMSDKYDWRAHYTLID